MSWHLDFFDELYYRFHSHLWPQALTRDEVNFIVKELALKPGDSILDLCCGRGRHALELARRGFEVTGVDLCQRSLAAARQQARAERLQLTLVQTDAGLARFDRQFDACILWGNSFGYSDDEGNLLLLKTIGQALKTGGKALLDLFERQALLDGLTTCSSVDTPAGRILERLTFDAATSCLGGELTYLAPGSKSIKRSSRLRLYSLDELEQLSQQAGLHIRLLQQESSRLLVKLTRP